MDWGLRNRLSHIIKEDGRTVMLAVDHGYFLGPTSGLEDVRRTIEPLVGYADSIMLTRGILRTSVNPNVAVPIVLRVSGGNSIIGEELSDEDITVSFEEAIRLNVSAVAFSIYIGSKYEHRSIVNLGKLVDEGERYGIPVLAVTAVGREMVRDAKYLALCCRIAAEMGAHLVKTYYCEDFQKVVETCPVPLVIAGGKKIEERDALELTFNAVSKGAAGVDMGRNIFQSEKAVAMIKAVRAIVHENATVDEAYRRIKEKG
ncbi:3-hydroxy-5-phosphonooxypentane-2,4-dione thiolase [candidate division WOR-3 bacterium]|nr:3-hydroxy-5-phosphonooxypentane-2,4-dione thiolase [candidate division WOR-3 bacterium]